MNTNTATDKQPEMCQLCKRHIAPVRLGCFYHGKLVDWNVEDRLLSWRETKHYQLSQPVYGSICLRCVRRQKITNRVTAAITAFLITVVACALAMWIQEARCWALLFVYVFFMIPCVSIMSVEEEELTDRLLIKSQKDYLRGAGSNAFFTRAGYSSLKTGAPPPRETWGSEKW
jgi:hypothetical protein